MDLTYRTPAYKEFERIIAYVQQFELDNRNLQANEFIAAFHKDELTGFGRLRKHYNCAELCTLGVLEQFRRKGVARAITAELIKRASNDIYLVTIIPDLFLPLGFTLTNECPPIIEHKLEYCRKELPVPEKYIAMSLSAR